MVLSAKKTGKKLTFESTNQIVTFKKIWIEYLLVFVLLTILTIVLFGRTLVLPPGNMLYGQDSHSFLFFVLDYLKKNILSGVMPWWNPYWFSGVPMLSNPAGGSIYYPLNSIFLLFPISKGIVYFFLIHMVGAGLAMYWFVRKYFDPISSCISAIILTFSGYMIGAVYMGHTETVVVMTWLPIILGSLVRFFESQKKKYFVLFVLSFTLQILSGTYVAVLFTLELIVLYFLFVVFTDWFPKRNLYSIFKNGLIFLAGIACAFGLSAVELVPFLENSLHSIRSEGIPYDVAARDSFNWHLWYIFVKAVDTSQKIILDIQKNIVAGSNIAFEYLFFLGFAAIALVALSIVIGTYRLIRKKKIEAIWFFICFATLVFFILAFGINFPFYRVLFEIITPYQMIRRPIRHLFIVTFTLAFLAGWGISKIKFRIVRVIFLLLISLELLLFGKQFIRVVPEPYVLNGKNYTSLLQQTIGDSRLHLNFRNAGITGVLLYEDSGSYYKIPMISGYSPMILDRYYKFVRTASLAQGAALSKIFPLKLEHPVINYLSAKYIVDQKLRDIDRDDKKIPEYFNPVFEDEARLVYENPKAFPRYFLVGQIGAYQSDDEALTLIGQNKVDLSKVALLVDVDARRVVEKLREISSSGCDPNQLTGQVNRQEYAMNSFQLHVQTNCQALLVTSEPYYPGWEAYVDGNKTDIYIVNTAFRSILIPSGEHIIEFRYFPKIFIMGLSISLVSLAAFFVFLKYIKWSHHESVTRSK